MRIPSMYNNYMYIHVHVAVCSNSAVVDISALIYNVSLGYAPVSKKCRLSLPCVKDSAA